VNQKTKIDLDRMAKWVVKNKNIPEVAEFLRIAFPGLEALRKYKTLRQNHERTES